MTDKTASELLAAHHALELARAELQTELAQFARSHGGVAIGDVIPNFNGTHHFRVDVINVTVPRYAPDCIQVTYSGARKTKTGFHATAKDSAWQSFKAEGAQ